MSVLKFRNQETGEWQEIQTIKGDPGNDGYTPQKGVDYFDGQDYVLTREDKQEIAGMVEGGIGSVVVLEFDGDRATSETLAILQEYYTYYKENGTLQPITFVMHTNWYGDFYFSATTVYIDDYGFRIYGALNPESSYYAYAFSSYVSDGSFDNFYMYAVSTGDKQWRWVDNYSYTIYGVGPYSHIKVVGYWSSSACICTYDISTSNKNQFYNESSSSYYVPAVLGETQVGIMQFYNDGGDTLQIYPRDAYGNDYNDYSFSPIGYYYWG